MKKIIKFLSHSGNLILLGFGIAACSMIFLAVKTLNVSYEMAVEGDYFELEKEYDNLLEAKHMAGNLGKGFNLKKDGNKLMLNIPAEVSSKLEKGTVEFFCLSDKTKDTKQNLQKTEDGSYRFDRSVVAPGHNYVVKVSFNSSGVDYYKEFKLM